MIYGGKDELHVKGYTNGSFQTNYDHSRSQSGLVFCLNGAAMGWNTLKKATIADSTTNAEYITASDGAKEVVCIKNFINMLGVVLTIVDQVIVLRQQWSYCTY